VTTLKQTYNLKLSAAVLLLTIATAQFYWLCSFKGFAIPIALADALGSYLLLYVFFLFLDFGIKQYLHPIARYGIMVVQGFVFTIIWLVACQWMMEKSFSDIAYETFWNDTFYIRGLIAWVLICDYFIVRYFVNILAQQNDIDDKEKATLQLRKEAELFKLRHQLHPHFLFNSLNSINALIGTEPKLARNMIQQLSQYLRQTLKKEDNNSITVAEELEDLHLYLSIEQVRFGHRLVVEEQIDPACLTQLIPPFLIQPLVENAIKYGLYGTTGKVLIQVQGKMEVGHFVFTITNPFDDTATHTKGTGFGIESIRRRLYLLYAQNDLLQLHTEKRKDYLQDEAVLTPFFTAIIKIPIAL
jgi:two-component system LytT family sensor kinase